MPPSGSGPSLKFVFGKEDGVVSRSLYSGLVVFGGVSVAFVAFALTVAFKT
jgi:hypothetical protein